MLEHPWLTQRDDFDPASQKIDYHLAQGVLANIRSFKPASSVRKAALLMIGS